MKKFILSLIGLIPSTFAFSQDIKLSPYLEIRPRYEFVEDKNNNLKNANALTVRTTVGVSTDKLLISNLKATIQATNVSGILRYFSPENNKYDLVADPDNTRITQAYLSYRAYKTEFIVGRKFITIDDHRFIGNVAWRQMPQSFTVIGINSRLIKNMDILAIAIHERLGITDNLNTRWNLNKAPLIFDINYKPVKWLKIKPFAYLLTDIHNTYGLKLSGNRRYDKFSISYIATYAKQTDPYQIDNKTTKPNIDTSYWRIGLTSNIKGFILGAEYTHFGDKNGKDAGFSTPFSTIHAFEGWSDILLTGGVKGYDYGLDEYKFDVGYASQNFGRFIFTYLLFNSYKNQPVGKKIGDEINAIYTKKLNKHFHFLTKVAFYNAENGYFTNGNLLGTKDATKYWLQITYKY